MIPKESVHIQSSLSDVTLQAPKERMTRIYKLYFILCLVKQRTSLDIDNIL